MFTLPTCPVDVASASPAGNSTRLLPGTDKGHNLRILIVDDNRGIHEDFRKILGQEGVPDSEALDAAEQCLFGDSPRGSKASTYQLASAYQGREGAAMAAEAAAAGRPFAVAFVDMRMPPGWDGLETIERLWQQQPDLQIVLCTAHSDYSLESIHERLDVSDRLLILKKPFDTVEALQLAKTLTEKWHLARLSHANHRDLQRMVDEHTTALVQANQSLAEQAQLINLAQDSISMRDLDGRVLSWNRGSEHIYGYRAEEAIGERVTSLIYDGEDPAYLAALRITLEEGEWTGEIAHRHRSGNEIVVNSRWTLLRDAAGEPKRIMAINSDVTEHKKLEAQFLRVQRLESVGTLASGVAHDLNNILAPILVSAPLLRDTSLPEPARDAILATIESSAERGAGIVRQVLTFAQGVQVERTVLYPSHLLEEVSKVVQRTFPKTINFWANCSDNVWPVEGDGAQLHQALLNLCVNARDAMCDGGELALSIENVNIDQNFAAMLPGTNAGPYVVIQVRDTGSGIPKESIDKVFDPFFTTKEPGQSSGLGLSTAFGIVKSHGGTISVSSKPGRGTTFQVFLPASPDMQAELPGGDEISALFGHGELALVVDDERGIREAVQVVLERHGYRVLTAADGPQALATFAQRMNEVDLVLTDMMMPFMDGVTLIRTLRKLKPSLHVIASTGSGDDQYKHGLDELGISQRLAKPYHKEKLLLALRSMLQRV